jgi:hypothetical protein
MVMTNGSLITSSGLVLQASAVVLMFSTALLFPLAFSMILAKYVAT